uniref:Uncharacterized protein n=1 Tax=Nelumbo nucifera TaxID=4432 RepID=A0A822ZBW4_NELNU|nr:TPA_asm: hypothetical protein HUJ06_000253 [Nelumbo nucifera]
MAKRLKLKLKLWRVSNFGGVKGLKRRQEAPTPAGSDL